MKIAGRRHPKIPPSEPIPNWALALVRHQPETECVAADGTVLARGRSQPLRAIGHGQWTSIRQGELSKEVSPHRMVFPGDYLTFDIRGD